jgi:predicted flap endonuclease-1-like 5' DNA nuclease
MERTYGRYQNNRRHRQCIRQQTQRCRNRRHGQSSRKGRKQLAVQAGIDEKQILKWVNRADLSRVRGIGPQYADLLEAAGVDTIPELAKRKADNLLAKMAEVNQGKKLVRKMPVEKQVFDWIEQAKKLPRVVSY